MLQLPEKFDGIRLLVQGEAPGKDEADESKAFVGKAGHWIRHNILANAGVRESDVLFDNTLRCLPPANKQGDHYPIGEDKVEAEKLCRQYDQWQQCPLSIPLLLVGGKALAVRLGHDSISAYHGHITIHEGRVTGCTFHPSAVMRNPNLLPVAIREIGNLLVAARNPRVLERPTVVKGVLPYHEGREFVTDLEWNPKTDQLEVVGIAYESGRAFSSFDVATGLELVRQHLESGTRVIGHNIIDADIPKIGTVPKSWGPEHVIDTMVVGHMIHAHLAELGLLGLGDLVRFYGPTSDWKQDKHDLLQYNGYDCAYNFRLWEQLKTDLDATEQWHLIEKQQKLQAMSVEMQARGIRIDRDALEHYANQRKVERDELKASFPINPNSPAQIVKWLREEFKISVTDAQWETLVKLRGRDERIDKLIEFREDSKSLKTWFPIETDKKGNILGVGEWIHPKFQPTGTAVARFSCADPNCQNIPPHLRRFLIPRDPENMVLCGFDAKNIENRTVAWISGDHESIRKWEEGFDPYSLTAMLMFHKSYDEIQADKKHWSSLNQKKESLREKAKTTELASIYGETAFSLANRMFGNRKRESLNEAERLRGAFFRGRPKIAQWHKSLLKMFERGDVMLRNPFGRVRFVYAPSDHEFMKRAAHFLGCSTAADIINGRALMIWDELGLIPILIVHDELVYELPKGDEGMKLARMIREIMELPVNELNGLVIPTEGKMGSNYGGKTAENPHGFADLVLN